MAGAETAHNSATPLPYRGGSAVNIENLLLTRIEEEWDKCLNLPVEQVQQTKLLQLISIWIGTGRLDITVKRFVEVTVSHNYLALLTVLTSAARERLLGANTGTHIGLIHAIGAVWDDTSITRMHLAYPELKQLATSLRHLMVRLVR